MYGAIVGDIIGIIGSVYEWKDDAKMQHQR